MSVSVWFTYKSVVHYARPVKGHIELSAVAEDILLR